MDNLSYALLIFLPVLLISISIHESMHALASHWLGDDSAKEHGRVSLNPLQHIDPMLSVALPVMLVLLGLPIFAVAKPVYVNMNRVKYEEFGGALIGMIGPLSNLALAAVAALIIRSTHIDSGTWADVLEAFLSLNIVLFVFNSIPWPPLDGSRLLYAFAPTPLQRLMEFIEQQGFFGLIIFFFLIYPTLSPVVSHFSSTLRDSLLG